VKLLGERIRKEGACRRGHDIRAATFVSRLSELEMKDGILQWIEEVLEGERALKAERAKKPKPAKTASERHRGEGNSAWSRRGGSHGG
jgi:hypothetical protein